MTGDATFGPWRRSLDQIERAAERRELKALATVFCGQKHSLVRALRAAQNGDADALAVALREIDALPALPRRRLLATFAAPPECSSRCSPIYTTSTGKHIMNDEFVFRPFKYSNLPVDVANPQQTNAEAQRRSEVESERREFELYIEEAKQAAADLADFMANRFGPALPEFLHLVEVAQSKNANFEDAIQALQKRGSTSLAEP